MNPSFFLNRWLSVGLCALAAFAALSVPAPAAAQQAPALDPLPAGPDAKLSDVLVRVVNGNRNVSTRFQLQILSGGIPETGFRNPELRSPAVLDTLSGFIDTDDVDAGTKALTKRNKIRSGDLLRISGYVGEKSQMRRRCTSGCRDWSGEVVLVVERITPVGRCSFSKTFKSSPNHWWDEKSVWRLALCLDRTGTDRNTSVFLVPQDGAFSTPEAIKSVTVRLSPKVGPFIGPMTLDPRAVSSVSLQVARSVSVRPVVTVDWVDDGRDAATFKLPSMRL